MMPPTYSSGWIYILENESIPDLFKIGFTRKTVEERIQELSCHTGVPLPFQCAFYCRVRNPEVIEKAVHESLAKQRVGKEFFKVAIEVAISKVRNETSKRNINLTDEWTHEKYKKAEPLSQKFDRGARRTDAVFVSQPNYAASLSRLKSEVGQLTPEVVKVGSASASLAWVPLKGHRHER